MPIETHLERPQRFTPRQLIRHHMEHPNEPITDDDITNLILESQLEALLPFKQHKKSSVTTVYGLNNPLESYNA